MKTILVTGATGSIGSELCKKFAQKGYSLIITARNNEKLNTLAENLKSENNIKIAYASADFNDSNSYSELLKLVVDGLDGLVIMPPQPPATNDCLPQDIVWTDMFKKSFIGPTALVRELIPALIKKKAAVVLISGITSKQPLGRYSTSNVLRTAWLGQIKTLADGYGPEGIRFNTLSLGGVITEKFIEKITKENEGKSISLSESLKQRSENVPLRKYAQLVEVVDMIDMLLTSEASTHLTGQNIALDGGFARAY